MVWALERTKEPGATQNSPEIMRCALFLSLIAAARAFAPLSIRQASAVIRNNEADAASTCQSLWKDLHCAARSHAARAARASTLLLRTKTPRRRHSIACNPCLQHPLTMEIDAGRNTPASTRTRTALQPSTGRPHTTTHASLSSPRPTCHTPRHTHRCRAHDRLATHRDARSPPAATVPHTTRCTT